MESKQLGNTDSCLDVHTVASDFVHAEGGRGGAARLAGGGAAWGSPRRGAGEGRRAARRRRGGAGLTAEGGRGRTMEGEEERRRGVRAGGRGREGKRFRANTERETSESWAGSFLRAGSGRDIGHQCLGPIPGSSKQWNLRAANTKAKSRLPMSTSKRYLKHLSNDLHCLCHKTQVETRMVKKN